MTNCTLNLPKFPADKPRSKKYLKEVFGSFKVNNWRSFGGQAIFVILISVVTALMAYPAPETYEVGTVADHTIRSDRELYVQDPAATAQARAQAYNQAIPMFVLDDNVLGFTIDNIHRLFRRGRNLMATDEKLSESFVLDFAEFFNSPDSKALLEELWAKEFRESIERAVTWLALELLTQGLVETSGEYQSFEGRNVEISRSGSVYTIISFDSILTIPRARQLAESRIRLMETELSSDTGNLINGLTMALLRPNMILDQDALTRRRLQAVNAIPEVQHHVKAGEIIIREGEMLTPEIRLKLAALRDKSEHRLWVKRTLGIMLMILVFMTVTQTISHLDPRNSFQPREQILVAIILLMFIVMSWSSGRLGQGLTRSFDYIESHTIFLAMPIPAASMLGAIFLGIRRTILISLLASLLGAAVAPLETLSAFIYLSSGSLVSIWRLRHISERGRLIPAAVLTAIVNCLTLCGIILVSGGSPGIQLAYDYYAAIISGLFSGILASGLVPLIELAMGFNTNLKMMELSNLNRPVLRDLMMAAPGTYHHSIIVGSMVEAAAEAIGANPHLARVGSYYHDIGKIKKPLYFIENQMGENKHETLTPTMSALVLVGHVKDGVELGRANNLPKAVIDIIEQHHGTSLMSFFYHKAQEQGAHAYKVNESDFRYPGPKPVSKESGLVMLADVCEAATRTLTEPTPTKIAEMVRHLVNRIFDDGQLDNCELTLKEVTEAIRQFNNILVGIYHHRIAYPAISKEADGEQATRSKVIYDNSLAIEQTKRITH